MKNKIDKNKVSYLKLIIDLSNEIGISIEESKEIVDASLEDINPKQINYKNLKEEILAFVIINIFSLICKL